MKAILISIIPKWVEMIASGKKTVEVRRTKPKIDVPFKCYIYCTKGDWLTSVNGKVQKPNNIVIDLSADSKIEELNGKVIGEFVCDKVVEFECDFYEPAFCETADLSCVGLEELWDYCIKKGKGYGWHITDLVIYDKPKELSEFWNADKCPYASKDGCTYKYHCFRAGQTKRCGDTLTRPPQSWGYVENLL